jgi:hypothetical protein
VGGSKKGIIKVRKFIPITDNRFLNPEEEFFETLDGKTMYILKDNTWYTMRYNVVSNNIKFIIEREEVI